MKILLAFTVVVAIGGFLGGIPLYIAGRILCPEIGIPVPPFGACYWVAFWFSLFAAISAGIGAFVKDL